MSLSAAVLSRRSLLLAAMAGVFGSLWRPQPVLAASKAGESAWDLSPDQWRDRLSPQAYDVLRNEGTERPFTSPLNGEKRPGTYHCAGCDLPLFSSDAKFDSGTGWPSFWQAIRKEAIAEETGTSGAELVKELSKRWKALSKEEQAEWKEKAAAPAEGEEEEEEE